MPPPTPESEAPREPKFGGGRMASFAGSDEDLLQVLAPAVTKHDWFNYNEPTPRGVKKAAQSEHNKLVGARSWLEEGCTFLRSLSFRKKQIHTVMKNIFDEKNAGWKPRVKPDSRDAWIDCNARRVWEACRDYGKALRRNGGAPSWVALMATPEGQSVDVKTDDEENALDEEEKRPSIEKNDIDDEEKHKKKDESKTSAGFHYGWDEENRTAWRSPFEAPTAKQFPTATPTVYNDQLEVSFLEKDGAMTKHIIREVSVADYKEMTKVDWETTRGPLEILPMEWDKNGKTTVQLEIHKKMTSTDGDVLLLFRCEELHLARGKQKRKQG